ncbi:hypothetical protein VKT23_019985 [Stygiomarasmius scandens]|uniref:Fungal STAND N-terminal Goodbye domain-containing protein n=1 Tax=Marasmiellus scandens TaxID=2682957 RepID=A0ABR1INY9_9AGAR
MSAAITADPEQPDFKQLWEEALNSFKNNTGIELRDKDLSQRLDGCKNVDDALRILEDTEGAFRYFRNNNQKWTKMRKFLKPVVQVAVVFIKTGAEAAASLSVPGAEAIFVALGAVLEATQKMSDRFDALIKLFKKLAHSLSCFKIRINVPFSSQSLHITVEILIALLNAIALATKMMKKSRVCYFSTILFTADKGILEALENLDRLITEQSQIIEAETLAVAHDTRVSVKELWKESALAQHRDQVWIQRQMLVLQKQISALQRQSDVLLEQNNTLLMQNLALSNQTSTIIYLPLPDLCSIISFLQCGMRYFASLGDSTWQMIKPTLTINTGDVDSNGFAMNVYPCDIFSVMTAIGWLLITGIMNMRPPEMDIPCMKNTIILIDALGYRIRLPLERCRTYEDFHKLLLENFSGKKAKALQFVQLHAYEISSVGSSAIIDHVEWPKTIRWGMELEMSIVLRQVQLMCPWCKTPSSQAEDGQVMKCPGCYREYLADVESNSALIEEIEDDEPVRSTGSPVSRKTQSIGHTSVNPIEPDANSLDHVKSSDFSYAQNNDLSHDMPGSFLDRSELSTATTKINDPQDMNDFHRIHIIYQCGQLKDMILEQQETELEHSLFLSELPSNLLDEQMAELQQEHNLISDDIISELYNVKVQLLKDYQKSGDLSEIESSLKFLEQTVYLTPDSHADKPGRLNNLGIAFQLRFQHLGELNDIEKAIGVFQKAVDLTPDGHPHKPGMLSNFGNAFQSQFQHLGEHNDIEKAIGIFQKAVDLTPDGHGDKPRRLNNLGNAFQSQFQHLGELNDIEKAIGVLQRAVDLTPDGHADKPGRLNNLGIAFQLQFQHLGELNDIEKAIDVFQKAVDLTPDGHGDKPRRLNNLGNAFQSQFQHLGELDDIEKVIGVFQRAVDLTPDGHADKPGMLSSLGNAFQLRFQHLGELNDIEKAIVVFQKAVDLTPDGRPNKPGMLSNFGNAFYTRFQHLGELNDIEKAIGVFQEAVDFTPDGHADKPRRLSSLGNAFQSQFQHLGELNDIEKAIFAFQKAVDLTPDGHADKPRRLNNLENASQLQFQHLEKAIGVFQKAIDLTPDGDI